jgi:hypothetical protein
MNAQRLIVEKRMTKWGLQVNPVKRTEGTRPGEKKEWNRKDW